MNTKAKKKIAVVGGGLVGLSTAYALLKSFPTSIVTILEKEDAVAQHQSGNNSGVIHSGIYYKPGSLKAQNCIRGRELLISFCESNGVAIDLCGKLIVANTPAELASLESLADRGRAHGLKVQLLDSDRAREIEPAIRAQKALFVPETGIVDFPRMAEVLAHLIRERGGEIRLGFKVIRIVQNVKVSVEISSKDEQIPFDFMINCAGLYSDYITQQAGVSADVQILPFRGEYYKLKKEKEQLCRNLIYPVPDLRFPFLGVHFTRMIPSGVECGPNAVFALAREGYSWRNVNIVETLNSLRFRGFHKFARSHWRYGISEMVRSLSKARFVAALQNLIPEIQASDLVPGGAGVRAQALDSGGRLIDDFMIVRSERALHVLNAPSPAATSCLSLGEYIAGEVVREMTI